MLNFEFYENNMQMTKQEKDFLKNKLLKFKKYLEIGSGYSTIWASQFIEKIDSVECREKWYNTILDYIKNENINNVDLYLKQPEKIAYDNGIEKWTDQVKRSDYGFLIEFKSYYNFICDLINKNNYDIILVDGNIRADIVKFLSDTDYKGTILVHDILPERFYLNYEIINYPGVEIVNKIDSMIEMKIFKNY